MALPKTSTKVIAASQTALSKVAKTASLVLIASVAGQIFSVLEKIDPNLTNKCRHVSFGLVEGMSSRTGNVILLESILETL